MRRKSERRKEGSDQEQRTARGSRAAVTPPGATTATLTRCLQHAHGIRDPTKKSKPSRTAFGEEKATAQQENAKD